MDTIIPQHSPGPHDAIDLTTHEHVRFPNGDHVIVHTTPGGVQVTGMLDGEWIEYVGTARDAMEQARLLRSEAPDALWSIPFEQADRIASAMFGAGGRARLALRPDLSPGAGEYSSERVALDGGHVDVDVIDQHVETTVTINGRITLGIALTPAEATRLGEALTGAARAAHVVQAAQIDLEGVDTVTDLFLRSQETGIPAGALLEGMGQ
jgi:adenosine/AMP kinase